MSLVSAIDIRRDISGIIRAPKRISVSDAASSFVKVRTSSGSVDKWDAELTPYMLEPMNCLTSRLYDAVIFVGPAQSGKTQALVTCFMAYIIKCQPSDFMILQTSKDAARDFDMQVVKRAFRDSPELKAELAPGSKSDNTFDKVFKSGNILFQAWPSINKLSGKPIKNCLLTDYDRMNQDVDGEGTPFSLAGKRTTTFLSQGMTMVETSPGFDINDPRWKPRTPHQAPPCGGALSLFNMGDMRRYYVLCPECGEYFMPSPSVEALHFLHNRDLFGITDTLITRPPRFICTKNGCLIDAEHKRAMNKTHIWVPDGCAVEDKKLVGNRKKVRIASFWFPGIFAAYANLENQLQKYLNALQEFEITGAEENLKVVINTDFGAPHLPNRLKITVNASDYKGRAEILPERMVCAGVRYLVGSVDVQKWGFSVQVVGYGIDDECWVIDRYEIRKSKRMDDDGDPLPANPASYLEDWMLIRDQVIFKRYELDDNSGRYMSILIVACDSGGRRGVTQQAYKFWVMLESQGLDRRFVLVKGERPKPKAGKRIVTLTHPDKDSSAAREANVIDILPLWLVNTTILKDSLFGYLQRTEPGRDYIHFPDWLEQSFYDELTAEVRTEDGWVNPTRANNEAFDLFCYAKAAVIVFIRTIHWDDKINWDQPPQWAEVWDKNPEIYYTEQRTAISNKKTSGNTATRTVRMRSKR